jgi:hypothetical protein
VQIISLSVPAGVDSYAEHKDDSTALARDANDVFFEATEAFSARLRGFAAISLYNVAEGVNELHRAVSKLNFIGWLTHSNFGVNEYLNDKKYWP